MRQNDLDRLLNEIKLLYVVLKYKDIIHKNALNYDRLQKTDLLCEEDKFFYELNEVLENMEN